MATTKQRLSAHVARAVRYGDQEGERTARQNLAEATISEAVQRALAASPPLSERQIKRISVLLRGGKR